MTATPEQPKLPRAKRDAYDWATLVVAVVGVVVVAWSAVVAAWNTELVREQITVMRSQDRPWVTSEVVPEHYGVEIKDGRISLYFEERLKNVGELVATDVVARQRLLLGDSRPQKLAIEEAQAALCAQASASEDGTSIFPDEVAIEHWRVSGSTASELAGSEFELLVVGCVAYNFFDSDEVHTTPYAFKLTREVTEVERRPGVTVTTTTDGMPFRAQNGRTPPSRIAVTRHTVGNAGVN